MAYKQSQFAWIGLRLSLGWIFLWAFIDKLFGLGFATKAADAWLAGGSPTLGFLKFAAYGPLKPLYNAMAGNIVVDVLFMLALLTIGVTLLLGIGVRLGSYIGTLLTLMMWSALLLPKNNPLIDEHIIYVFAFLVLSTNREVGKWFGLGKWWTKKKFVKKHPILE